MLPDRERVRLELLELDINRIRRCWNLYFVVATEHPTDPERMVITAFPSQNVEFRWSTRNHYCFVPDGAGTDGLLVLDRTIPPGGSLRTRLWLRHSRSRARNAGAFLRDLAGAMRPGVFQILVDLLGADHPWYTVGYAASLGIPVIADAIARMPDRDLGMVSLDETFEEEFERDAQQVRVADLSTGHGRLRWRWSRSDP